MSTEPTRPRLYEPESIAIATFLGSPLAGAALWAINERRVGRAGKAWSVALLGVVITVVLLAASALVPPSVPTAAWTGVNLGLVFGLRQLATTWLEKARADGLATEPVFESRWKAAGAGGLGLVLVLGVVFGLGALFDPTSHPSIEVRPGAHLYYDGVDEADARHVAEVLEATGLFAGEHAIDVLLTRTAEGHAISLVIDEQRFEDGELAGEMASLAAAVQPQIDAGGRTELRACDETWSPHHTYRAP
ncbi:MAG: hypothetical protein K1X94_20735 [Sandaracinaceae bacterium]|nr:hypothetical protein [Sandaracinaceae bacterium]